MPQDSGSDESIGLYFLPENEGADYVQLRESDIILNQPKTLKCLVPASLAVGEKYRIKVVTQFMHSVRERKTVQSYLSDDIFTVV